MIEVGLKGIPFLLSNCWKTNSSSEEILSSKDDLPTPKRRKMPNVNARCAFQLDPDELTIPVSVK